MTSNLIPAGALRERWPTHQQTSCQRRDERAKSAFGALSFVLVQRPRKRPRRGEYDHVGLFDRLSCLRRRLKLDRNVCLAASAAEQVAQNAGAAFSAASVRCLLLSRCFIQSARVSADWPTKGKAPMLHWAAVFFVIAIVAAVFGFGGIAASAAGIAKTLFVAFLALAVISLLLGRRIRE